MKALNFIKENLYFFVFLIIILSYRIVALYHFKYIDFEDANIALMARDILEGKKIPLYAYGVPYNAGEVIDAFMLALFFKFFGFSNIVIKSLALIENLILLMSVYAVLKKLFAGRIAMLGTILFSFSPSIMVWNFYYRGYLIDTIFYFFVFYYFWKTLSIFDNKNVAIFGILSGLTFWMKEFIIILLFIAWIFIIIKNLKNASLLIRRISLYTLLFLLGYLPGIIYNFTHDFLNWKILLKNSGGLFDMFLKHYQSGTLFNRFILNPILSTVLFSEPYNDLNVSLTLPGTGYWFANIIIFFGTTMFIIKKRTVIEKNHLPLFYFILLYLIMSFSFLTLGFAEPYGYIGTRFYVLLYPLWIILITGGIYYIYKNAGGVHKFLVNLSLGLMLTISLFENINVLRQDFLIKEYEYLAPATHKEITNYPVTVRAKNIDKIIEFLSKNSINYVFTTLTLKMRLLVETNFKLCIASYGYYPLGDPYPECREEVLSSKNVAVIHLLNSPHIESLESTLKNQGTNYLKVKADDYVIFYPVDMRIVFKK